jgi:hypothetical protein
MAARDTAIITGLISDHDEKARLCDEAAESFRLQSWRLFNGRSKGDILENADFLVVALEVLLHSAKELRGQIGELPE